MSATLRSASALVAPQAKAFTGLRSTPAVFARWAQWASAAAQGQWSLPATRGAAGPGRAGDPPLQQRQWCLRSPPSPWRSAPPPPRPCSKPAGFAAVRRSVKPQRKAASALQATSSLVEFAQVANEAGFIGGVASTMIGMTLLVSGACSEEGALGRGQRRWARSREAGCGPAGRRASRL